MANGNNDKKKNFRKTIGSIICIIIIILYFINTIDYKSSIHRDVQQTENEQTQSVGKNETATEHVDTDVSGELILTMIDVGQADCFLLRQNGQTALIDCGTRSTGKDAVKYLKDIGIERLDYVFGTHPHDDHMGGMYDVITNFEIGKVIIPKVEENITTNWYIKLMKELANGNYNVIYPNVGDVYELGDATMKVIGPLSPAKDNKNNYSTVLKVSFGDMDIIMTGDAETKVEKEILQSGENIDAEILKVGHHGSDTSSCEEFLDSVSPDYGLISSGVGNKYKHPIKSTMENLKARNIKVYRTDESGTVTATITANDVTFDKEPGDYLSGPELAKKEGK